MQYREHVFVKTPGLSIMFCGFNSILSAKQGASLSLLKLKSLWYDQVWSLNPQPPTLGAGPTR